MEEDNRLKEQYRERTLGCMVGGAAGDALGFAVEFNSWDTIEHRFGSEGIRRYVLNRQGLAMISDDTQMSLFTAAGILLGMTRGYMRGVMGRIDGYCRWTYIDWLHTQEWTFRHKDARVDSWLMNVPGLYERRAPGGTCLTALHALENREKVKNDSCGCGGVMRTAPLALLNHIHRYADGNVLYCDMCAAEAARLTHKHPLGFLPSAVLNHILMGILSGEAEDGNLAELLEKSLEALPLIKSESDGDRTYGELWPKHVKTQQDIIRKALALAATDKPDHIAIEEIGGGWTGHEALAIAIYSAVKHQDSFEEAIISAVNHSGDSDSTGSICGNIIGCLLGRSAIPAHFTEKLELLDVIEEMAEDLYTGCIISEYNHYGTPEMARWDMKYCEMHWEPKR